MDFAQVIKDRYSCKKYDGKPVTAEQLSSILEAGRLAPTAKNLQEQHIYVVQSAEGLDKIDKLTPCRYGAPTVLVVAFNKDSVFTYPGGKHSSGAEDAAIVATHLMLAATNAAVDSCWINFFDPEAAAKALGRPRNRKIQGFSPSSSKMTFLRHTFSFCRISIFLRKARRITERFAFLKCIFYYSAAACCVKAGQQFCFVDF